MENASKALIIAGAILLAILLISLGIMIFGQAQDTVNNSGMSQAEISSFNNKFIKYEKKGQTGSVIKSLVNEALASNADASLPKVTINLNSSAITSTENIDTSAKYDVKLTYSADGYVDTIDINDHTTTP